MSANDANERSRRSLIVSLAILVIVLPIVYSAASHVFAGSADDSSFLEKTAGGTTECVEPTQWMRFHHMDLLKEIRDDAVRDGRRGPRGAKKVEVTFTTCTGCHASRAQFCDRCHEAVNLYPDCFDCHYYPK